MRSLLIPVLALVLCGMNNLLMGQLLDAERSQLRKGNRAYESGDLSASQEAYEQALEKNEFNSTGHYNLGNTLYGLTPDSIDRVADHFQKAANYSESDDTRARAYHNLGNTYMRGGKYKESVEAYKKSLRLNPKDEDTRYNLAYAMEKLRQQQQQQQNQENKDDQEKNEDENQDKNQDKDQKDQDNQDQDKEDSEESENQDEQDQNQENQEQENKEQQNKDQQESKQQNPAQQMSKEEIEQMLEALRYQEEKLQEKMQKKKVKGKKVKGEKDW